MGLTKSAYFLPAALLCAAIITPRSLFADTKAACVVAYNASQRLRRENQLAEAKQMLIICSQSTCPPNLRVECAPWLDEVKAAIPSVVVRAKNLQAEDTSDVRVEVDGVVMARRIDGSPIELNPGRHVFRFFHQNATIQQIVVMQEREKGRAILVDFSPRTPASTPSTTPPPARLPAAPAARSNDSISPAVWIFGGLGVVALGSFSYFGLKGSGQQQDLDACAPHCQQSDVDAMRRSFLIGDISLGVGVLSLGTAAWIWLSEKPAPSTRIGLWPTKDGGQFLMQQAF